MHRAAAKNDKLRQKIKQLRIQVECEKKTSEEILKFAALNESRLEIEERNFGDVDGVITLFAVEPFGEVRVPVKRFTYFAEEREFALREAEELKEEIERW